ncbi:MAG TPA: hypothetical protein VEW03_14550 [Longimicrobiaceae bacterium]|nr:hypothetical protein [Longimicrobiaceae bacterium]
MAEINVERKPRNFLPWILGLLLVAVLVFVVWRYVGVGGGGAADGAVVVDSTAP